MQIWDLKPGVRVQIRRPFIDLDGQCIEPGERVVAQHDHFAYDNGHTLVFADGTRLRLAGVEPGHDALLDDPSEVYWRVVSHSDTWT